MSTRPTRLLPIMLCALPYGCTLARTESPAAEQPLHFTVGRGPALAKDDKAEGEFVAEGKRTVLRHAYAVLDKAWNEDAPTLKLRLSDVPLPTRDISRLEDMAEKGAVRFLEARLDDKGGLVSVHLCNLDVAEICIKTVEFGDRKTKLELDQRDGHHLRGRLSTSGPKSFMKVHYSFSAAFTATLWETSSAHLGTKPDGSFGVAPGRATGTVTFGGESMRFAHAFARQGDRFLEVALTPEPLSNLVTEDLAGLQSALLGGEVPSLFLRFRPDGGLAAATWTKTREISCRGDRDEVRFTKATVEPGTIAGTAYSTIPEQCGDRPYEFKVSFQARVGSPPAP